MRDTLARRKHLLQTLLWSDYLRALPVPRRQVIWALRLGHVLVRELFAGELNLRAMSMVYTTLLSVVPLLAFVISLLKSFGIHNRFEPLLRRFLAPLGPQGAELATGIIAFVSRIDVGLLGGAGLILLVYTLLSLLEKIETSLNFVWKIGRLRPLIQRFNAYLGVVLIGPLLVFSALGIIATMASNRAVQWLTKHEPFGTLIVESSRLAPYVLIVVAFTFIYVFMPNTRVKLHAALIGGLVAGFLWQTTGWAFATFIVNSAQYAAIYSGFAILVLLLIWLYFNWLVLLIGAQISFLVQNPQYLTRTPIQLTLSNRLKQRLALSVMYSVAERHHHNAVAWTAPELAEHLHVSEVVLEGVIASLIGQNYLVETQGDVHGIVPARDIATIDIASLLAAVDQADEDPNLAVAAQRVPMPVEALLQQLAAQRVNATAGLTLRDLVDGGS